MSLQESFATGLKSEKKSSLSLGPQKVHRIMEWFGLEGTLKDLVQPPGHGQGHLSLGQVTESPVHLTLNTSKDGASTTSLGDLFQCLTTLIVKKFLPYI